MSRSKPARIHVLLAIALVVALLVSVFPVAAFAAPSETGEQTSSYTSGWYYRVKKGDTLTKIAAWYGTTVQALVTANHIKHPSLIYPGQWLFIPAKKYVWGCSRWYVVKKGDNLYQIARRFGKTVMALQHANHIKNANRIYVGQKLCIPVGGDAVYPPYKKGPWYMVKKGDTLSHIAKYYGTTVSCLATYNHIKKPSKIYVGQVIRIVYCY